MMKVLSRINPSETYHRVSCRRGSCEDVVVSGLSITPSDIERLARQGVPVSVPNASSFFSVDSGLEVPPELRVDADRNSLWELSQATKRRIMQARRREKDLLT
jgi:hypothetical protein